MRSRWLAAGMGLWFSIVLSAQVRLSGRVTNDTNSPVANAELSFRVAPESPRVRTYTDPGGLFLIQLPAPGDYIVDVAAAGMYPHRDRKVTVSPGLELNVVLVPVREFSETVDVNASSTSVALDKVAPDERLSESDVLDVPFPVTHNVKNAMRALPGVVQDNTNGIHLNGGAENQALYLLNGFNIGDPLTMRFDTRLSIEAIQSMQVESGAVAAEYGKGSAGVISVNTRTGDDRIRYSATNFIPGVENQKGLRIGSWNPRLNLSGPLRRGRVWFSDSFASQYEQTIIRELPRGQDEASSLRFSNLLHIQANLAPSNIASFGLLLTNWNAVRTGLGALDPPSTTTDRRSRQIFAYAKDQWYLGRGAVAEVGYAANRTAFRQIPQGHDLYVLTPSGRFGNYFIDGRQEASRDQIIANFFAPAFDRLGNHQLKGGADLNRLSYWQDIRRTGFEWLRDDGSPIRRVLFAGNGRFERSNFETAAFLQDSWRVRPNVLLEFGIRSDWDRVLGNWTYSPRAGLAWSPKRSEATRISAGYAVSYDATNLELFTRPLDQAPVTYYFPPYGYEDRPVPSYFVLGGRDYASPRFTTLNVAVDQRLPANIYLRAQAIRRRGTHGLTYVGGPFARAEADRIYQLTNARADFYDGVEFTFRQNFRTDYSWMASYVRSRARSTAALEITPDNPLLFDQNSGRMPWDAPNRVLTWGYLPAYFKNWAIAYLMEYRSGFPFTVQNEAGRVIGNVNSRRYPDFFELNVHIERRFHFRGQRWAVRAGINNITDHQNPNTVNNNIDSPLFLSYYGGQSRAVNFRLRWMGKLK